MSQGNQAGDNRHEDLTPGFHSYSLSSAVPAPIPWESSVLSSKPSWEQAEGEGQGGGKGPQHSLIPHQTPGIQLANLNPSTHRKLSWGREAIWGHPALFQSLTSKVTKHTFNPLAAKGQGWKIPFHSCHYPQPANLQLMHAGIWGHSSTEG